MLHLLIAAFGLAFGLADVLPMPGVPTPGVPTPGNLTAFMDAIDCVAAADHRACAFIIRTFFHDAVRVTGANAGADGSAVINDFETAALGNAQHGAAAVTRVVLTPLVQRFGLSYADALSVGAAQCTQSLDRSGSEHVVSAICSAAGWPLLVGKVDNPATTPQTTNMPPAPGEFQFCNSKEPNCEAGQRATYWVNLYNELNAIARWRINSTEATALMGAHTLLPRSSCTTDGFGNLRVASWDNSYYKDVTSGTVYTPNVGEKCVDTNGATVSCAAEDPATVASACGFATPALRALSSRAVSQVTQFMHDFGTLAMFRIPLRMRWYPDPATRAPCRDSDEGLPVTQCAPCQPNSTLPWCAWRSVGEAFFPYQMIDASMGTYANPATTSTCRFIGSPACHPFSPDDQAFMDDTGRAYHLFAADEDAWKTTYAISHCKHSDIGATYFGGAGVDVFELAGSYSGTCRP